MSLLQRLVAGQTASRIWRRDTAVFAASSAPAAVHDAIAHRLGWLDAPQSMAARTDAVRTFTDHAQQDGLIDVHLLGMGGSSLCAEVLRETAPEGLRGASLLVLDTTDEQAVDDAAAALSAARALFLVASKSGTTIEVSSLERFFGSLISRAVGETAGRHFAAITDPATQLVEHARERGYRECFLNPPDIGGRYSALPLIVLFAAGGQDPLLTASGEIVAVEVVKALVGSVGIVAAVPLTTAMAVLLVDRDRGRELGWTRSSTG